ncbi:MAG: circularly permuted type 2 ATP-grasp protein, partial [Gammaproteobacteria bacterium]
MAIRWGSYRTKGLYDELLRATNRPRPAAQALCDYLRALKDSEIEEYKAAAELAIRIMGITFTVYSEAEGSIDRAWPFDIIPRIIDKREWDGIAAGLHQRVRALNLFIDDLYHEQRIIKDKVFPQELLDNSTNFRPQCRGIDPPQGV